MSASLEKLVERQIVLWSLRTKMHAARQRGLSLVQSKQDPTLVQREPEQASREPPSGVRHKTPQDDVG